MTEDTASGLVGELREMANLTLAPYPSANGVSVLMNKAADRIEALEAANAVAREALKPFAECADHDIGETETDNDTFRNSTHNRAPKITVGDLRRASQALAGVGGEGSAQSRGGTASPKSDGPGKSKVES